MMLFLNCSYNCGLNANSLQELFTSKSVKPNKVSGNKKMSLLWLDQFVKGWLGCGMGWVGVVAQ